MKHTYRLIVALVICTTLWGCSDSKEEEEIYTGAAAFGKSEVKISAPSGKTTVTVDWTNAYWEITKEQGKNFITNISPAKGGGEDTDKQQTKITVSYSVNQSAQTRTQDLYLKNLNTGEMSKLTIRQEAGITGVPVTLDASVRYQPVVGFGGMYNPSIWTGSNVISDSEIDKMYAPSGLGYNILRLMVYPNQANWATDVKGALRAQQHGAIVFASPWYVPDSMKEKIKHNGRDVDHLKRDSYQDYANHLVQYINYMKASGVNLYAISVQNEPDMDFTFWYPQEVADFVKAHGEQIRATGVKLMSPEGCGMQPDYNNPILNDPLAFEQTDILVGHLYQGFINWDTSYAKNRHDYICGLYYGSLASAGKTWWMTEHLFNDGEKEADPAQWKFRRWSYNLETLGKELHMSMEGHCSAYIYWYLKRFYGMIGDNDARSAVSAGEVLKNGYILGHYAQYASNTTRIKVTTGDAEVKATAYISSNESEITIVLLNMKSEAFNAQILCPYGITAATGVETSEYKNMQPLAVQVADNGQSAFVSLSPSSIVSVRLTK